MAASQLTNRLVGGRLQAADAQGHRLNSQSPWTSRQLLHNHINTNTNTNTNTSIVRGIASMRKAHAHHGMACSVPRPRQLPFGAERLALRRKKHYPQRGFDAGKAAA